ncbi:phage major tail protein, TP901-1 family [Holzapfeliella sp. He02]|uniref:Phage major tail protein, TP901-1 family n=1 Tax=Holzapfeliella saturejae TaxID=3082953 RepID=A0ABU8SIN1_9LACO
MAQTISGYDVVAFIKKADAPKGTVAKLVPYQTSDTFNLKRDSDTTKTKTGNQSKKGTLETEFSLEMLNNDSQQAKEFRDSVVNDEILDVWRVYRKVKNDKGNFKAYYFQVKVTEDNESNPVDDDSTRSLSFSVITDPLEGYLPLPDEAKEAMNFVFKGLDDTKLDPETGETITNTTTQGAGK